MTNKEIFDLADHAVDKIDLVLGNYFELEQRNPVEKILLETVSQAVRKAKTEAFEEAAKEVCHLCKAGSLLQGGRGYDFYHPEASIEIREHGHVSVAGVCAANRIHLLRDSLVHTLSLYPPEPLMGVLGRPPVPD
jgi:hypothetical protein